MANTVATIVIALLITYHESAGELTRLPRDTTAKVNQSAYFNCSTNLVAKEIFWSHGADKYVYTGGEVLEGYKGRVTIDVDNVTGACNLVIHSVQASDAGEYKCKEEEGTGVESSAQLIVLDDEPICQSNVKLDNIIGQNTCNLTRDMIELSCSVTYHGKTPPQMEWRKIDDDTTVTGMIPPGLPSNTHRSNLMLENDISLDNSAYVCQIKGTALNQYNCTSDVIRVSYSVGRNEVVTVERGKDLTCSANTTFSCSYRWFHKNNTFCPVSCNEKLRAYLLGEYHCEAICTVREKECKFVAMNVSVIPKQDDDKIFGLPATISIAVGSCLLGGIIVAIVLYLNPRKKPRNIEEALKFIEYSADVLLNVTDKEKLEYSKRSGKDNIPPIFVSDQILQSLKQVHLMFPKRDTARAPNTEDKNENSEYCEIKSEQKQDDNAYSSIENTTTFGTEENSNYCKQKTFK